MVEKGNRGRICHSINRYTKTNNKYMKDYDKNEESSYYMDVIYLYGWVMSQKLLANSSKWVEDLFKFDESLIKSYNEKNKEV